MEKNNEILITEDTQRAGALIDELEALVRKNDWPAAVAVAFQQAPESLVLLAFCNVQETHKPLLRTYPQVGAGLFHASNLINSSIMGEDFPQSLIAVMMSDECSPEEEPT